MRIKICGITTTADARDAALLGADAVGLNFYPRSKRCITLPTARAILRDLPPFVDPVGLFVNQPLPEIIARAEELATLRTLQIHGDTLEPVADPRFRWLPAFPVRDRASLDAIDRYLQSCQPAAVLVDAHVPGEYGGTGHTAPWHLLAEYRPAVPLILAGGLVAENITEAIRIVRPFAVDVASGVESTPGQKDQEKMRRFIGTAREAAAKYGL